jgi:hypothetical protein
VKQYIARLTRAVLRSVGTVLVASVCVAAQPATAFADGVQFGVRGGYYTKVDKPFLGAELLARVAPRLYFNPNVEYVFVDNGTYMTFNGDFHYDFPTHSRTYTWLGAGLALVRVDPEGLANANTDLAANLLGGIGFRRGSVIPYIQAKAIIKSDSLVSLAVGLRF